MYNQSYNMYKQNPFHELVYCCVLSLHNCTIALFPLFSSAGTCRLNVACVDVKPNNKATVAYGSLR